jgi:acyl-coenzyme A synthetase/AMP-(fatty) acid ligase
MLRTIWGDNERYLKTYWEKFQNRFYVAGDSRIAMRMATTGSWDASTTC